MPEPIVPEIVERALKQEGMHVLLEAFAGWLFATAKTPTKPAAVGCSFTAIRREGSVDVEATYEDDEEE